MMCRSFSYCTGLNAVTKIFHKKPSKQEAKPKYSCFNVFVWSEVSNYQLFLLTIIEF